MKAKTFDQPLDKGVDITASLDLSKSKRVLQEKQHDGWLAILNNSLAMLRRAGNFSWRQ